MSVSVENIHKLAKLSRLEFSDAAAGELASELGKIVEFISQLDEANTENVTPMTGTMDDASSPERQDTVTNENNRDALLAVAPNKEYGFFKVPKVIE